MHKTYTRLAGAAIAAGIGLGTAGLAPLATAETTPHTQTDRQLSDAQKRAVNDTVTRINDQVRGALGAAISDARVEHKDGKDVLSWDVDTHKLRDILHMSDDNAVLATTLPEGVNPSTFSTDLDTVSLSDLARGDSAAGKAVVANLPSADQLNDPKVREAFTDAISKAADSGLWPEIKPLVDKAGGADKFADQLLSARGISANDISSLSRSVGGDKVAPSVFIPFDKSTDKVTLSADITDGSFGDNTRDKVAKASTPLAFTVGDVTLLDGKIDPNLVNHVPANIRAIQIGDTTLGQVLKDAISSINDVLGDVRDNIGDNDGRIGDGDSLIPTEGASEDAEAILDRIREILNPENKPTPSTAESETSTTESKKPAESKPDKKDEGADKPAEPTDKKDEDKKPTQDEAREALEVLERYVNETEGENKPADSTEKPGESDKESESATSSAKPTESSTESTSATPRESESTSPSKKSGIMDSLFGGGDSEGKSSDGSSNEPVDNSAGDTGVVSPAVNEDTTTTTGVAAQDGGSAPAGGKEKSAPRDRSQDSVFANRQGSGADESAPQPEDKDYNAAAEGSMPVTGASSATKWMLGGAVALILGGLGAIIALRRKEVQQS